MENTEKRMAEILDEISRLPVGNITHKTIRGKSRMYLQWRENGKNRSKYIKAEEEAEISAAVERRKALEAEYRNLKNGGSAETEPFFTNVKTRDELTAACSSVEKYGQRECMNILKKYLHSDVSGKVCLIYGLRRTGKTTMLMQAISELPKKNYTEDRVDFVSDKELYTGEMMAALFSALSEYAKNNKPDTATRSNRAYIMAEELIKKFPVEVMASIQKEGVKFRSEIERAVDKAYDGSNVDITPLTAIGFVDVTRDRSKHFKLTYGDNKELTFTVSRTPSAHTSRENCKRSITSRMCIV